MRRLVFRHVNRRIQQGFIFDNAVRFMPTRGADNDFWCCIINTFGKFSRSETTKYHRMHSPHARAAKHGNHRFGNHRHINNDTVTGFHTKRLQHSGELSCFLLKLGKSKFASRAGDRRVIYQRILRAATSHHMPVNSVKACIHNPIWKPTVKRFARYIQRRRWWQHPINAIRSLKPEPLTVTGSLCKKRCICTH